MVMRLAGAWSLTLVGALAGCALVLGFEDHQPFPEETGGHGGSQTSTSSQTGASGGQGVGGEGAGAGVAVLLISDRSSTPGRSVGMYDPMDGSYLGDFIPPPMGGEPYELRSPNHAAQGPDGRIYVSDQTADAIFCFEATGAFHSVFADESDGLDNLRGMDFRNQELFVSTSPPNEGFVARFDLQGNRLANYVDDDSNPFDVLFLADGKMMLANIGAQASVRLYDAVAFSYETLLEVNFPQQIQPLPNGNFVVAAWSELIEFEIDGSEVRSLTIDIGRGVHPLANGEWLLSSNGGVQVISPFTQQVVEQVREGSGYTKIEQVVLPALPVH